MNCFLYNILLMFPLAVTAEPESKQDVLTLEIGKFSRDYEINTPLSSLNQRVPYIYDFIDDVDLIELSAYKLAHKILNFGLHMKLDTIIVPGDKANSIGLSLTHILRHLKPTIELVVLRSSNCEEPIHEVAYHSSTEGRINTMYIRPDQVGKVKGKNSIIVDDVISTGSKVKATKKLVEKAGGSVLGFACVATEGPQDPGEKVHSSDFHYFM